MDMWSRMLAPWMSVRMPAGGDLMMNYHPSTNWGWWEQEVGDPVIEQAIFSRVASPGMQLGKLLDAVNVLIAIVEQGDLLHEGVANQGKGIQEFEALKDLAARVSAAKQPLQATVAEKAEKALEQLQSEDGEAFEALLGKYTNHPSW